MPNTAPPLTTDIDVDETVAATVALVMNEHKLGWYDVEDTLSLYKWILADVPEMLAGTKAYPTVEEASEWLHQRRIEEGRDEPCDWCTTAPPVPFARPMLDQQALSVARYVISSHPAAHNQTEETVAVYLWLVADAAHNIQDGHSQPYDDGTKAGKFLHQWREENGINEAYFCPVCL